MEAWKRLGGFIGDHMAFVSPTCVVLAVLFPEVFSVMKPAVTALFAFMTFQGAISNTFGNLARTVRHPLPMVVTLLITTVLMPVLACGLATLIFGSNPNLVCGIVLEYTVPVAVTSAIWINLYEGDPALGLATTLVSTVAAPFTIPFTLHLLLGQVVEVDAARMMGEMLVSIALPALAGTAVNEFSRGWGARQLSPVLAPAAKIALIMVILANSTGVAPYVRNLTPQLVAVTVFIGLFACSGFAWGVLAARLMRKPWAQRVSLTYLCGLRNISAGAVLAGEYFPGEVMFPVVIGTLFQQVLSAFWGTVLRRMKSADAAGEAAGELSS